MNLRNQILIPIACVVIAASSCLIGMYLLHVTKILKQNIMALAQETAYHYGNEIKTETVLALDTAKNIAYIFKGIKKSGKIPDRNILNKMLKNFLEKNPQFMGVWVCWEPDALDGMDDEFINNLDGNAKTGRYMPYWHKFSGKITLSSLEDIEHSTYIKYYNKAKNLNRDIITEPIIYKTDTQEILYINLIAPIIHNNIFVGAAGVSISMNYYYKFISQIKPFKTGYGAVVSNKGIIAAHPDQTIMGRFISEYIEEEADQHLLGKSIKNGEKISFFNKRISKNKSEKELFYLVFAPFEIGNTCTPWSFLISLPENQLYKDAKNIAVRSIITGVIFFIILIIIIFLISHHIVKPLYTLVWVSKALAEGDFDKRANLKSKNEFGMAARYIDMAFDTITDKMFWYESILNAIPFPVSVTDMNMNWTFINTKAEDILGLKKAAVIGKPCHIWAKDICNTEECSIALLKQGITTSAFTRAGTEKSFKQDTTWLRNKEDKKIGHVEIVRDITEAANLRKKTENRNWLQSGEAKLYQVMHGEQDIPLLGKNIITFTCKYVNAYAGAFYLVDNNNKKLELKASYAYKKRKNLSNEFKIGEGIVGQTALEKETILLTNVPKDYIKIDSALGSGSPHNIIVIPFLFQDKVTGVIELGAFHEFSELEQEFLEKAVRHIGIVVNTARSHLKMEKLLVKTQTQAEELQVQQEELRQSNEELELQTRSLKESKENLQAQQEELRVINEELEARTNDLEKQHRDIQNKNTALLAAQQEIEQKAQALETASKYKSEFMANMSHELRTPLNSILILSQLLSNNKEGNLTDKQREFADTIYSSGDDLLSLINEILDLSKVEAGKLDLVIEEMNLAELSEDVRRTFDQMAAQKDLTLTVTKSKNIPQSIKTDIKRVWQVIKNLLSNAFKFTDKGSVDFSIYRPESETNFINKNLSQDNAIAFAVSDTGIGIHESKQSLIFEAFQQADGTTSRKYGGTGLGLSISKEFAKALGGEIQLHSEPDKGSTFTLFLPLDISDKTSAIQHTATSIPLVVPVKENKDIKPISEIKNTPEIVKDDRRKIKKGNKILLIIEDDAKFCRILLDLAREKGFKVLIAEDGETGLHFADFYKPSGIILDIGLPGIDGWTVMERLKQNSDTRHIPVHFISVTDKPLDALRMGAVGFLTKPVSIEMLEDAFKKIEHVVSRPVKKLLVVEDDEVQKNSIIELIGNGDVKTTAATTGEEAYSLLQQEYFDCIILDLGLGNMSGFDLLSEIRKNKQMSTIPVIIYTGKDITREEEIELQKYADSIIIKGVRSPERLLDETTLFLHKVKSSLPKDKQQMLSVLHDIDSVLKDKKILIVDDDMRNVFALASVLEEKGVNLIEGRNGIEALKKLDKHPDTDLVIMDIMMPEMDGYEAIKKIREKKRFQKLPIIALTAKAMKGDKLKCVEAGANDYLAKPVETGKLLSLLRVWLY